jgi:hypothetical protein
MTIDERLDRLVERHQALALSVELLQSTVHQQSTNIDKLISALKIDGENIAALARIAEAHERRLTDLEG